MANDEHVKLVRSGTHNVNAWRQKHGGHKLDLAGAKLDGLDLARANLSHCDLQGATLHGTDLSGARLLQASFIGADVRGADFTDALVNEGTEFRGLTGAAFATGLHRTKIAGDPADFENVKRAWWELVDWAAITVAGRLPLFSVSYVAVILIPVLFFLLAFYNRNLDQAKMWAQDVEPESASAALAGLVADLPRLEVPGFSLVLLVSVVLLAAASTIYALACPHRIKQFTREQWVNELNKPLIHYWPISWKRRWLRLPCAVLYIVGAVGVIWVIVAKVCNAAVFIAQNT